MDRNAINRLIDDLALWRETEQAAEQDVEDADARVIAADMKFQQAKIRLRDVSAKVSAIQDQLASAIIDLTAPVAIDVTTEGDD